MESSCRKNDIYYYRRDDNGKLEKVAYGKAIEQDAMGYIELEDGSKARRVYSMDPKRKKRRKVHRRPPKDRPIFSDTLGVTAGQLQEMEADRKINGFGSVEFVPDPQVKGFFLAKVDSDKEKWRYAKHRGGMVDHNSRNGSAFTFTEDELRKAEELVRRSQSCEDTQSC